MNAEPELDRSTKADFERLFGSGSWRRMLGRFIRRRRSLRPYQNIIFFSGGFLFDVLTLDRIDAMLDILTQGAYLAGLFVLIFFQHRQVSGTWSPSERFSRAWGFNLEALHFLFGGLLSAYVIFYTKSGVNSQSLVFFVLVIGLLVLNELPTARRWDLPLRVAILTFCVASYLIYLVPVFIGRMGDGIFLLSLLLALLLILGLVGGLVMGLEDPLPEAKRLAAPGLVILVCLGGLYFLRWIPPVPLSLKYVGIFHKVERRGEHYDLTYERGAWYEFFRRDDSPFRSAAGERMYCFVRIFAPARFSHKVSLNWLQHDPEKGDWVSHDRIPLPVLGGRRSGYRGYAFKANFSPGRWRVRVETEDRRVIGERNFRVLERVSKKTRWQVLRS